MVAPHEITAVGIEMLINEEAEVSQIQRLHKANAAALRLEEEPARAKNPAESISASAITMARAEPPPVSAAAHFSAAPPKQKAKPTVSPPAPVVSQPEPVARAASVSAPPPTHAPAPASSSLTLDAFFRGAGLPARKLDDREAEQVLQRLGQLMREVVLGIGENLHLRSEQKNALRVPRRR
jgi:predicted component of type VI protein secretion system